MRLVRSLRHTCVVLMAASGVFAVSGCNRGDQPAQMGRVAPDFTLNDGEHSIHLGSYRGRVVLLNLWFSNCGPCIQETPALVALHHERPDLAILAVSIDEDAGTYKRFLQRFHVDLTTVRDPEQKVAKMYGADGWPETYIIDRTGIIRRKVVGNPDWSTPEMRMYLQGL